MEIDLERVEAGTAIRSQVCVVGAGIAGLTLAHRVSQQGVDVVLLEAGGRVLEEAGQSLLQEARLAGEPHVGTHEGRFRVFGGASVRWGGQLLPSSNVPSTTPSSRPEAGGRSGDISASSPEAATNPWPPLANDLAPHYAAAEQLLGVDDLPYEATPFFAQTDVANPSLFADLPGINARLSKWTPFSRRNLAKTLGCDLLASDRVRIYLHAQVTELALSRSGDHLEAVIVRTRSGASFRFAADHFVLAAGTVETCRLLLASRSVASEGVGNTYDQVGRNFHDHLTLSAATITGSARAAMLRELRPWVFGATQHSFKLEASEELRRELAINPVVAHLTFEESEGSGLALIREMLVARQQGGVVTALKKNAARLPGAVAEAARLAWSAKIQHRRFISAQTKVTLKLNVAQDAPSASRITLGADVDAFGLPQAVVDWRISEKELATFRRFAGHLRDVFERLDLADGVLWNPELFTPNTALSGIEDARHAMGGACMGTDPHTSVVDSDLTVHGVANLSAAGLSTFPEGSPQLPTLLMMALTLRLADRLGASFLEPLKASAS